MFPSFSYCLREGGREDELRNKREEKEVRIRNFRMYRRMS
jgi:hypothetical protein